MSYNMVFYLEKTLYIVLSDIPEEYKIYESHSRIALKKYSFSDLYVGQSIVSVWD